MKPEKQILHYCLIQAKEYLNVRDLNASRDCADTGIAYLASRRRNGMSATDLVEGVRIELWLERFWIFLQNNDLML